MTRREDQPQQVVADVLVERRLELLHTRFLPLLELVSKLFVFAIDELAAAEVVDRAAFGDGHQPCAGISRDAGLGPLLERGDERVVREVFGKAHVSHDSRDAGDDLRRLDAPHRIDGVCCSVAGPQHSSSPSILHVGAFAAVCRISLTLAAPRKAR
jgi:hypothetical protein